MKIFDAFKKKSLNFGSSAAVKLNYANCQHSSANELKISAVKDDPYYPPNFKNDDVILMTSSGSQIRV